jgi:DNA-binding cell septation regulator SpoVG
MLAPAGILHVDVVHTLGLERLDPSHGPGVFVCLPSRFFPDARPRVIILPITSVIDTTVDDTVAASRPSPTTPPKVEPRRP